MARETVFQKQRREKGTNWANELKPTDMYRLAPQILYDIANNSYTSNEDKWTLATVGVLNALVSYTKTKELNLFFILEGLKRNVTAYNAFGDTGLVNQQAVLLQNVEKSYELYHYIAPLFEQFMYTMNPVCMTSAIIRISQDKNYISPNNFI